MTDKKKNYNLNRDESDNDSVQSDSPSAQFRKLHTQLKTTIQEVFNHNLKDMDLDFLKLLFTCLPTLDDIWNRIGFNHETKEDRLHNYYQKLKVTAKNNKIL